MKKIYFICREEQKEALSERLELEWENMFSKQDGEKDTEIAYLVGTVTPDMLKKAERLEKAGVRIIRVNDNLINEDLYEKMLKGKVRVRK